jgi:hypothetical protein
VLTVLLFGGQSFARPIECRSSAPTVKAVTDPDYHYVTTAFQFDDPNLQVLLSTSISVTGTGYSCIIAHLSGLARITDNYIVFQLRVDGVPMQGHLSSFAGIATPVVFVAFDDPDEQDYDPTDVVSFNFFQKVQPGVHTVEVMVAAGSAIDVTNYPTVSSPVLTLEYR